MQRYIFFKALIVICLFSGCKKFTDIDFPINQVGSDAVFASDGNASAAIAGIYTEMMSSPNQFANCALTFYAGLSADELKYYSNDLREEFFKNEITNRSHETIAAQLWGSAYKYIYVCNLSLEKLAASNALTPALKSRLMGECYYLRAFSYFALVNLFGDVPLTTGSDYSSNMQIGRTAIAEVYKQITKDLLQSGDLLPANYETTERAAPNKWAAKALLAKVYLYRELWDSAAIVSKEVIQSGAYQLAPNLNDVFLKGSTETLWQLASVLDLRNSWEGFYINPNSNNSLPTYIATPQLLTHFETGDLRKLNWLKQRTYAGNALSYPFKYKVKQNAVISEYQVVMRLAEVLLIRAEANAKKGLVEDAVMDINAIRNRAGLTSINNTITADSCMRLIMKERQSELFAEWGNRWFDLKRWKKADEVLSVVKGATWQATDVLYPIPQTQIDLNGMLKQNPGY